MNDGERNWALGCNDSSHNIASQLVPHTSFIKMTRSHKANDRDHKGLAEGTALPHRASSSLLCQARLCRCRPQEGGTVNDDIADEDFTFTNARRRSNSSSFSHHVSDLKTKFEVNEPEPVFEESVHGPEEEDHEDLTKTDSSESGRSSS
ncbi:hypothetical protein NW754_016647 [Fusarium falciforme]|nr:hypothetical protein NW754_016647 [Fusarium falciforme]